MGHEYLRSTSLRLVLVTAGADSFVEARKKEEIDGCRNGAIPLMFQQYTVKSCRSGGLDSSRLLRFRGGGDTEPLIDLVAAVEVVFRNSCPRRTIGTPTEGLCRYLWLFSAQMLGCRDADRVPKIDGDTARTHLALPEQCRTGKADDRA